MVCVCVGGGGDNGMAIAKFHRGLTRIPAWG